MWFEWALDKSDKEISIAKCICKRDKEDDYKTEYNSSKWDT